MVDEDIDGPRLGELLLAEIVGRDLGAVGDLSVDDLDDPAGFRCDVGDRYRIRNAEGDPVYVDIEANAITIVSTDREMTLRVETGGSVKTALDELSR